VLCFPIISVAVSCPADLHCFTGTDYDALPTTRECYMYLWRHNLALDTVNKINAGILSALLQTVYT